MAITCTRFCHTKFNRQTLNFLLAGLPQLSKGAKPILVTSPVKQKVGNQRHIFSIIKIQNIELPAPRTTSNSLGNNNRKKNGTVIRKRTRQNITGLNGCNPRVRTAKKIDAGGEGTIPPRPSERSGRWMKTAPDINNAAGLKQPGESQSTFTRDVINGRASAIKGAIKDGVKVTTQNSWNCGINQSLELVKEKVPGRIIIRRICTQNTKTGILKGELNLDISTNIIKPRTNKAKCRAEQYYTAARPSRTRRHETGETSE